MKNYKEKNIRYYEIQGFWILGCTSDERTWECGFKASRRTAK